jgi:hypothetical protein
MAFLRAHTNARNSIFSMGLHHGSLYRRLPTHSFHFPAYATSPVPDAILARIPLPDFKTKWSKEFGCLLPGQLLCFLGLLDRTGM